MLKLIIEDGSFQDTFGRQVVLRGINFSADAKLPVNPYRPSHIPDDDDFFNGDDVTFVGSPFGLDEVDSHLERLKAWGFNTLRYVFTWEAIEHKAPGVYDDEFIEFTIKVFHRVKAHGFYAIMDPHQDCWARYAGGCGAPLWTLYAAGMEPRNFKPTQAAMLESHFVGREQEKPKMLWASNYTRLAAATMYTLFFAGKTYAPKCTINGVNIQEYLETHYINAVKYLATRICKEIENDPLLGVAIIGWESLNEPGHGFIGLQDITEIPKSQQVKLYTTPTCAQAIALGAGFAQQVQQWEFTNMGGKMVADKVLVDPEGASAWLTAEKRDELDAHYGWARGPHWDGGKCVWQLHGVWKEETRTHQPGFVVLRPDYFAYDSHGSHVSERRFVEDWFLDHWLRYTRELRTIIPSDSFLFFQPPVLQCPPDLKSKGLVDPNMVYTPHYYDGLTLMLKHWNPKFNVDAMGVIRGRYGFPPIKAVRLGETNIRNCIAQQLKLIKQEGIDNLGASVPCLISEIGIPFDMDDRDAYSTGDYDGQARALDANCFALESALLSHTLWCYAGRNTNEFGDGWNGEDLSIWSTDPAVAPLKYSESGNSGASGSSTSLSKQSSSSSLRSQASSLQGSHFKRKSRAARRPVRSQTSSIFSVDASSPPASNSDYDGADEPSGPAAAAPPRILAPVHYDPRLHLDGARAPEAFIRPFPLAVAGMLVAAHFDMMKCTFQVKVAVAPQKPALPRDKAQWSHVLVRPQPPSTHANDDQQWPAKEQEWPDWLPTVLFLPNFHFSVSATHAWTSANAGRGRGRCHVDRERQLLYWWHDYQETDMNSNAKPGTTAAAGVQELKLYGQLKTVQTQESGEASVKKESCRIS